MRAAPYATFAAPENAARRLCMLVVLSGSVTIEKLASDGRYLLMREARACRRP